MTPQINSLVYNEFGERMILDGDTELSDKIRLLSSQMNAGEYELLKLLAEFDRRHGWGGGGVKSCAHWLNWKCGVDMNTAREKLRVAKCLENLPLIDEAFKQAEVSYSKVRAMTRVATPENEDYFLYISRYGTTSHIEKLVRKYKQVKKSEAIKTLDNEHEARDFSYYQDDDGMWVVKARLPMVEGGLLIKAINEVASQKFIDIYGNQDKKDKQNKNDKKVSAETFKAELDGPELIDKPNMGQIRADVLTSIAEHYIATASKENGAPVALKGHERCQVVLHVDAKTLKSKHTEQEKEHECCEHEHNPPPNIDNRWITIENAKRFSSDASILTAYEDEYGNVLNVGRNTRTIPPALARALNIRDETCRFPGCCESNYVDFHHIQHWANNGPTNVDNLVKLCRFHHRALHSGLYTIERRGSCDKEFSTQNKAHVDTLIFKTKHGIEMPQYPELPKPESSNEAFFSERWPDVNCETGSSHWCGETMDYGMAIDGLVWRDSQNR